MSSKGRLNVDEVLTKCRLSVDKPLCVGGQASDVWTTTNVDYLAQVCIDWKGVLYSASHRESDWGRFSGILGAINPETGAEGSVG